MTREQIDEILKSIGLERIDPHEGNQPVPRPETLQELLALR
ncbi:MAG: hypothetical protein QHH05_03825 [Syntrophomonadaceae bacterium]|jgi:hypothetical protein|nr:hypothetical protein [Syntrophomonadaceae bacterium]MDH7497557.1 hypothetical protein [Syntrophomonadaceae bacterium]